MSKSTTKPQDNTPVTQESPRPPSKPASVFYDGNKSLVVLEPKAVARASAASQAIATLSGILANLHDAADWDDDAPPVDPMDTRGILSAIGICAEFLHDSLTGGGLISHRTLELDEGEHGFDQIEKLTHEARAIQKTKLEKRRLEIVGKDAPDHQQG
jgi:hypothetical protein